MTDDTEFESMRKPTPSRNWMILHAVLRTLTGVFLAASTLGQPAPSGPVTTTPQFVSPQDLGLTTTPTLTATPLIQSPPTITPSPQLLPSEQLGPILIDGTTHRTQEAITVRVRVGRSVDPITCSWTLQDTGQTTPLGAPISTTSIDANTNEKVFTFTPQAAGTYVVNCTGIATTVNGQRPVSAAGTPFAVEAKG